MANEDIGTVSCPLWHDVPFQAFIRMDKGKKLYVHCPECGISNPRAKKFQERIKKIGNFFEEYAEMYASPVIEYKGGGEPEKSTENTEPSEIQEIEKQAMPTEKSAEQEQTPVTPKRSGLLTGLFNALGTEE